MTQTTHEEALGLEVANAISRFVGLAAGAHHETRRACERTLAFDLGRAFTAYADAYRGSMSSKLDELERAAGKIDRRDREASGSGNAFREPPEKEAFVADHVFRKAFAPGASPDACSLCDLHRTYHPLPEDVGRPVKRGRPGGRVENIGGPGASPAEQEFARRVIEHGKKKGLGKPGDPGTGGPDEPRDRLGDPSDVTGGPA